MTDPYKILGVSPTASDEEIKQAYRELVRKYHPDKYADSDLADLATEKMKEINAAYEEIQKMRQAGTSGETGGQDGAWNPGAGERGTGSYARVRALINDGNLDEAEVILLAIVAEERGAEWHFLMGCVLLRRGQLLDAQTHLDHACRLDPYNTEYRAVRDRLRNQTRVSGGYGGAEERSGCSGCDICTSLLCADCCCECMGGDLIRCC